MYSSSKRMGSALVGVVAVVAGGLGLPTAGADTSGADAATEEVVRWNQIALRSQAASFDQYEGRNLAMTQVAVFDAVNATDPRYEPYLLRGRIDRKADQEAAVAAAAHSVLVALYPAKEADLNAEYNATLARVPDGPAEYRGVSLGRQAAKEVLKARAEDGSVAVASEDVGYTPGAGPGLWRPTPPDFSPAFRPSWGRVAPFLLESGSQFRPGPPPSLTSDAYTRDFLEVVEFGSRDSASRTPEQTAVARFWRTASYRVWNQPVQQLVIARHFDPVSAARAFALLHIGITDSLIASWDAKFTYHQWRPVTAIREADSDGNPATEANANWLPLLPGTPSFPDYLSGHAAAAGAAEGVLNAIFGPQPGKFTLSSPATNTTHTFTTFETVAQEVVDARVWGGIHWRTSDTVARAVGNEIATYAVSHGLQPGAA